MICWLTSNGTTALAIALLICDCRALLSRVWTVLSHHIFREANSIVDGLTKRGVIQKNSLVEYAQCPTFVNNPYIWDHLEKNTPRECSLTSLNTRLCSRMTNGPTFVTTT